MPCEPNLCKACLGKDFSQTFVDVLSISWGTCKVGKIQAAWMYACEQYVNVFVCLFVHPVTFATAAVRSYISTVSRNSTAAAVFLRLHTLAVTFATAAVRRILIYGDRKTGAALRPLRWWRTVAVGRPCGSRSFYDKY